MKMFNKTMFFTKSYEQSQEPFSNLDKTEILDLALDAVPSRILQQNIERNFNDLQSFPGEKTPKLDTRNFAPDRNQHVSAQTWQRECVAHFSLLPMSDAYVRPDLKWAVSPFRRGFHLQSKLQVTFCYIQQALAAIPGLQFQEWKSGKKTRCLFLSLITPSAAEASSQEDWHSILPPSPHSYSVLFTQSLMQPDTQRKCPFINAVINADLVFILFWKHGSCCGFSVAANITVGRKALSQGC